MTKKINSVINSGIKFCRLKSMSLELTMGVYIKHFFIDLQWLKAPLKTFCPNCNGKTSVFRNVWSSFDFTSKSSLRHICRFGPPKSDVKSRVHCIDFCLYFGEFCDLFRPSCDSLLHQRTEWGGVLLPSKFFLKTCCTVHSECQRIFVHRFCEILRSCLRFEELCLDYEVILPPFVLL